MEKYYQGVKYGKRFQREQACWLALVFESGLTIRIVNDILVIWCKQLNRTLQDFFAADTQEWEATCQLKPKTIEKLEQAKEKLVAQAFLAEQLQHAHIHFVTVLDPEYPQSLKSILGAFPAQLQELDGSNPALLRDVLATIVPRDRVRRVVFLRRRNKVAQAVSFPRAAIAGIWRKEQEGINQAPPDYSQHLVKSARREIAVQENAWSHMFRDLRIEPLSVWHEDVLADPTEAAQQVADYLGVTIDPASSLKVPEIRKQSQGDLQSWIDQFSRSRGA